MSQTASGQQKLPAATPPALIFTLGVSRVEALRKVARLLDAGLPDLSQAAEQLPDPGAAVVLRILALQVKLILLVNHQSKSYDLTSDSCHQLGCIGTA